ncbi:MULTISPECIES: hypothetical protein [unclassified Spirillospora]|uniref:hypothetical protein n=1 Tax=unclassified Spirillospora TaxID=2642701 RepID=UPI003715FB25
MLGVFADLPWSYAAGAGIALAAAHQLGGAGPEPRPARGVTGRYFMLAMTYSVVVFVPASLLVAHAYPRWATLHHRDGVPLAALAAAEIALTAAGFLATRFLLAAGRSRWAACQVLFGCLAMCLAVVHGPGGDGWKRFVSADPAAFADFPEFVRAADAAAVAGHVAVFLTSGLAVTLYATGAVTLGALALIMCVLHQFGLTDAAADGPGPLRAGLAAAVTAAGIAAVAALISLLVHGIGWVALAAVAPVLWAAVAARGAFAAQMITDLALPADHPTDE